MQTAYYTHKPLYSKIFNSHSSSRHKKKKRDIAFYHRAKSNQFISEHSRIESKDPIESNRQILGEETWFSPRGFSIIRKCCSPPSNGRIIRRWERNFILQERGGLEISSSAFENVIEENQKCFSVISRDIHRLSFQQKFSSLIFTTSFSRERKKKKRKSNVTPRRNYFPHFQFTPSTSSNPPSALHCPRSGGRWKFMESENFSENSRLRSDGIKVAMCTCKFILNETR